MTNDIQPPGDFPGLVFVVDNDLSVREALSILIRSGNLRVETFSSANEFLRRTGSDTPSCLVLDVRLPDLNGLALQRDLAAVDDQIPIIFITGHGDIPMTVLAIKAGALAFLPKPFEEQELLDAIAKAIKQDAEARLERSKLAGSKARFETLSKREREVMERVVRGLLNKQVAGELGPVRRRSKFSGAR